MLGGALFFGRVGVASTASLWTAGGSFFIVGRDLPKMLQEGESHSEMTALQPDLCPASENVKSLFMWDASGKYWKLSRKGLKKLKQEARDFQPQPQP